MLYKLAQITGGYCFEVGLRRAGILRTMLRFGPSLARMGLLAGRLTVPFSKVVDRCVSDPWLRRFLDLECFVLRRAMRSSLHCFGCRGRPGCAGTCAM